jgi:hypothetical protein
MDTDELIAQWSFAEFCKKFKYPTSYGVNNEIWHLVECGTTISTVKTMGWECGCYSEYTREDYFDMYFDITCECGMKYELNIHENYGLPGFIEKLDAFQNNDECYYWDEDYS